MLVHCIELLLNFYLFQHVCYFQQPFLIRTFRTSVFFSFSCVKRTWWFHLKSHYIMSRGLQQQLLAFCIKFREMFFPLMCFHGDLLRVLIARSWILKMKFMSYILSIILLSLGLGLGSAKSCLVICIWKGIFPRGEYPRNSCHEEKLCSYQQYVNKMAL